jgi:hypothetical protein
VLDVDDDPVELDEGPAFDPACPADAAAPPLVEVAVVAGPLAAAAGEPPPAVAGADPS